jgi:uncharacterized protein YyaL (SSP411 family)
MINKKRTNNLMNEKSPYLLQHAHNPVDWHPWNDRAFRKALEEDKPIFLSIGYSTCHWCHIMAHESFEDPEVAKLMNETFVSIKVDREERPDIDKTYMLACQLMTNSGGWPLTILMTPDKKPFFAGTYIPKTSRFGRMGLMELIPKVKDLWRHNRQELISSSERISYALNEISSESPGHSLDVKSLDKAYSQLSMRFDDDHGGFGRAPKFPAPHNLLFLLRYWRRTQELSALEMVKKTLIAIRQGGIYDQVGHGFHRYSTDDHWLVPHFEKMLYDQALLALVYIEAYQATGDEFFATTAKEIFEYVLRDMRSEEGGFYSAEDADSEGEEGKFYLWSEEEINHLLSLEQITILKSLYNSKKEGNYIDEAQGKRTGKNILHMTSSLQELSRELNYDYNEFLEKVGEINSLLFAERSKRIHPYKDDKILTDWNGLMIAALSKGGFILNEKKYIDAAIKAVSFIKKNLMTDEGILIHNYRQGPSNIPGFLDDYAFLIWGLLNLYEATFELDYLKCAIELNEIQLKLFWDDYVGGGFYFSPADSEVLMARQKEIYDGAIPSGNSVSMMNLLRLATIMGKVDLEEKADFISKVFAESVRSSPAAHTYLMCAVDFAIGPTYSLVISGDTGMTDTLSFINALRSVYLPNISVLHRPTEMIEPEIDNYSNFIEFFDKFNDKATSYVCINKTCKPPTNEVSKMLDYLSPLRNKKSYNLEEKVSAE